MSDTLKIYGNTYTGIESIKAEDPNGNELTYIRPQGSKSITTNGNNIDVAEYATVDVSVSSGPTTTVVVPEQTLNVTSMYTQITNFNEGLIIGETYKFTINGVTYTDVADDMYGSIGIGNANTYGAFDYQNGDLYFDQTVNGSYVVKVEKVTSGGGNEFIITVSQNSQTGYWEPDCTWADLSAAYSDGKTIAMKSNLGANPTVDCTTNNMPILLEYVVHENGSAVEDYWITEQYYSFNSSGLTKTDEYTYYDTSPADATSSDILSGAIAYGQNGRIIGSVTARTSSDLSISGNTVTAPAGFYSSSASASVASGTEGTPTATKGTVSNHSISVTPSVTNTAGYIQGGTKTGTAVTVTASELASGNKAISSNGTNIDVVGYETVSVTVPETSFIITVSKNQVSGEWEPDCTYAQVLAAYNAGMSIAMKADNNSCADCYTYVDQQEGLVIAYTVQELLDDGQSTPQYWIEQQTYIWVSSDIVLNSTYDYWDTSLANAVAGDVASGKVFYNSTGRVTGSSQGGVIVTETSDSHGGTIINITSGTTVTLQSKSVTPTSSSQTILPDTGYDGMSEVIVAAAPGPNLQTKSATPTESAQTITPDQGYDGLSSVQINAISSSYVGSGVTRRSSSDVTGGQTAGQYSVSVPSGYYANNVTHDVPQGSVGTPTATKGTVSNHSVSVTPSVAYTGGYIYSSSKTGTAVTVTASELVSGSETKTTNGTYDVTNLASLVVAVPIVTYYTGSSAPSSSLGSNGDIYLQTS